MEPSTGEGGSGGAPGNGGRTASDREAADQGLFGDGDGGLAGRLLDTAPDAIVVHDGERILYVNALALELIGTSDPAKVIGRSIWDFVPRKQRAALRNRVRSLLRSGGRVPPWEVPLLNAEGGELWVEFVSSVADAEGRRLIQTVLRDVTAEMTERRRSEQALRRSEERLASIIRAAPLGITLSRLTDGTFLEVNDEFAGLVGYTRDELLGVRSTEIGLWVDPQDRRRAFTVLRRDGHLRGFPTRFLTRSGEVVDMLLFTEVLEVDGDECALTMLQNVTESRRLEEQLRQAQKMEAVGRLAGGIAHDFNNLLTALVGHVDFLLDGLSRDDPLRHEAEGIQESAERAKRLTRQLLAFSRQQMLNPRLVDLGDVIASFGPLLNRLLGAQVELDVHREGGRCLLMVDPGQLEQVVLNLAVNARDAMPDGGRLSIDSRCVEIDREEAAAMADPIPAGRYGKLTVRDTGVGMDEATIERIFDPFFTTKPTGRGTGLGLSTVYGIINQSSGHIRVQSDPGGGTRFTIYLPAAELDTVPPEPEILEIGTSTARGDETVLLVEDERSVRTLATRVLTQAGYTVHPAVGGAEALDLVERLDHLDLLVTDVVMPGISGRELAQRLRQANPDLPVVYMSGYTVDEVIRDQEYRAGNFLEKPFTPGQLVAMVRRTLDR